MNKNKIAELLLAQLPLDVVDVVRLFVESIECAGIKGENREEVMGRYRRVVQAGIRTVREEERTVSFGEAVRRSLEARKGRRASTLADLRSYTGRMLRHKDWAQKPLRGIRTEECRELLHELFGHSASTCRKGRSILHSIFAYGRKQGWCAVNPVANTEVPAVRERRIEILNLQEIRRLHAVCLKEEKEMAAPLVLMLWCGIRPGEMRRLRWSDVDSKEGVVYIEPRASKTGGARAVELRGAARALLPPAGVAPDALIAPPNWNRRWQRLRKRAGLHVWQQDKLRHTFASMHLRHYRNLLLLQAEMGHRDSTLLRTRYLNLRHLSTESARRFWTA